MVKYSMKINKKSELPCWFQLDKYNILNDLNDVDLESQLKLRIDLFMNLIRLNPWRPSDESKYKQILNNDVILKVEYPSNLEDGVLDYSLSRTFAVEGFPWIYGYTLVKGLESRGELAKGQNPLTLEPRLAYGSYSVVSQKFYLSAMETVDVSLDLKHYTDKEIVDDIKILLPKWRNELKIKEPPNKPHTEETRLKKVLHYEIIPLLDLKIWCEVNKNEITQSVYAGALFPEHDRGDTEFKQTIIPFLKKLISGYFRY